MISSFRFPTQIYFGSNSINMAYDILQKNGIKKAMIICDQNIPKLPWFQDWYQSLKQKMTLHVYSETYGNPTESQVIGGINMYREVHPDGLILVGGGCAVDVGKAIAVLANHKGSIFEYEDDDPKAKLIDRVIPFMMAIPTTSGTGSEVGGSSVIADNNSKKKVIIWAPSLIPKYVLADPEVTKTLPANLTAATGIDALTHNLEAFLVDKFHPMCDGIALEGLRLIANSLVKAYENPTDTKARGDMLAASMMGATAFQKGLGVTHSCAHALSAVYDTHHGLANAQLLVASMRFNESVCVEKFERVVKTVGAGSTVQDFFNWISGLLNKLNIPSLNVKVTGELVDAAYKDSCHLNNPRKVTKEDLELIFNQSINY